MESQYARVQRLIMSPDNICFAPCHMTYHWQLVQETSCLCECEEVERAEGGLGSACVSVRVRMQRAGRCGQCVHARVNEKVESNNIPHANLLIHSCIHWGMSYHTFTHACMCTLPNPLPALYFLIFSRTLAFMYAHTTQTLLATTLGISYATYLLYRSTSIIIWL